MGIFAVLIAILLLILVILSILMVFICIRIKVKSLLISYKNSLVWNGIINTITLGYIKYCVSWWVSVSNNIMNDEVTSTAGDYISCILLG